MTTLFLEMLYVRQIERGLPEWGDVYIFPFTDRQYENIIQFSDQARRKRRKNPDQLALFDEFHAKICLGDGQFPFEIRKLTAYQIRKRGPAATHVAHVLMSLVRGYL
ncbi:hypothetical protein ACQ3G6_16320 [Allorhizobium undicola]|uniref:hypothetical protein n=1 Tax=Allorhizobium undicola TaxID=78527 RepID=UPI003D34E5FE